MAAILFLYKECSINRLIGSTTLSEPKSPSACLSSSPAKKVRAILIHLEGSKWIVGTLLYGAVLRLLECLRLRVKDIDFDYKQIVVRDGKGAKHRVTMLPTAVEQMQ
jgi:site-specific recombinase XerC